MDSRDDKAFEHLVLGLSVDQHPVLAHPRSENTIGYMYAATAIQAERAPRLARDVLYHHERARDPGARCVGLR
jgi:hypothetical protein